MIVGLQHVGISVSDLDRSIRFYRDAFGLEVVVQHGFSGELYEKILAIEGACGRVALLKKGNLTLELFEFVPPPQGTLGKRSVAEYGISHFCVEVTNIAEEYERLRAHGVPFHCAPLDFSGIATATYGRDPDGNVFELWEDGPHSRSRE